MEDSVKNLELIRFDLTARNVDLQEKVVRVQEQNQELQKRPVEEQDNTRMEDLAHQLDDANKQIMKLKLQQKTKVKNLTKQLDGLKKVRSDSSFGTNFKQWLTIYTCHRIWNLFDYCLSIFHISLYLLLLIFRISIFNLNVLFACHVHHLLLIPDMLLMCFYLCMNCSVCYKPLYQ